MVNSGCRDEQRLINLSQEVACRGRNTEVDAATVGPHQTPVFTLLGSVVDRSVCHVLAEWMRSARVLLECKRTTCIISETLTKASSI